MKDKEKLMLIAIEEAKKAFEIGEVPVGAIVVKDGVIIGKGHNKRESKQNPVLHAEIVAIMEASKKLKSWRLEGCEIYVTLEPCPMCAGALILSRIKKVYFGARDPKKGAIVSKLNLLEVKFNHSVEWEGGILEEECGELLRRFFKILREEDR
ncbi:MAG: nucleoside deaminase [Thermosulfidibacteraceae bacterium]|jgi:tRNA(adenine34) deaminase